MSSAVGLAMLCLLASGLVDLTFKLYATHDRSRGMLVCGVGLMWFVFQFALMSYTQAAVSFDRATWFYGVMAAIFVTLSNILLLECLGRLPISIASTIYRLNTVPLVVLAYVFLGEELGFLRSAGILAGLATVVLLYQRPATSQHLAKTFSLFLILIIAASCIRALYGIFTKAGVDHGGDANTMILLAASGWCIGGLLYAHFREQRVALTSDQLKFIPAAGCLVFSVVWLLTTALKLGEASVVIPIANMGFIAALVFSVVLNLETLTGRKMLAVLLAALSIILLSSST